MLVFEFLQIDGYTIQLIQGGDNMTKESKQKVIGEIIKKARLNKNLTQADVATDTGISRNYLSDVENGRYMPSVETLLTLARHLEINLNLITEMTEIQV